MNCKFSNCSRGQPNPFERGCDGLVTSLRDKVEGSMSPIDYFTAIFVGMCIGMAGVAFIYG
jgi:hypothetical protein